MSIAANLINEFKEQNKDTFTMAEIVSTIVDVFNDSDKPTLESNGIKVVSDEFNVYIDGIKHYLPKKLFQLLFYLIQNKNRNLTRHEILRDVWGYDVIVGNRTIDVHIRKLREFLPIDYIQTNKGLGYKWVEN